jgi:hypothetical protein
MKQKAFWFLFLIGGFRSFAQQAPARHEFSIQQCIDYAAKNNVDIKNAMVDVDIQEQQNRAVASAAYPHINGSFTTQYNPNVTVQTFPNFIAAGTYGVLEAEGVKNGNGEAIIAPTDFGVIQASSELPGVRMLVFLYRRYCSMGRCLWACRRGKRQSISGRRMLS